MSRTLPIAALGMLALQACTAAPAPSTPPTAPTTTPVPTTAGRAPTNVAVEYQTGSIPPPYNHGYTLAATFETDTMPVTYDLVYEFREGMTEEELAEQGYTTRDDIHWEGTLTGQAVDDWRALVAATTLGTLPEPMPGSDLFRVTIGYADGSSSTGMPNDRDAWEELADTVDQQARTEIGHPRPNR